MDENKIKDKKYFDDIKIILGELGKDNNLREILGYVMSVVEGKRIMEKNIENDKKIGNYSTLVYMTLAILSKDKRIMWIKK